MSGPVARGYFDPKPEDGLSCKDPSLAVQASKDECDINVIVKRYLRTGELPGARQGVYADISHMVGLQDAIHMVADAEQAFLELPAEIRRRFDNDPVKLVAFAQDDRNYDEAVKLGLANPKASPPSQPAPTPPAAGGAQPPSGGPNNTPT